MTKAKLIACSLSVVMLVSAIAVCVIPASANVDGTTLVYTAIGDSIAAGYKLPLYTADGCTPADGYVSLFAAAIGATKINDKAISGSDTYNTLAFLQNADYAAAIAEADVITVSMGSNDILGPGQKMIAESLGLSSTSQIGGAFSAGNADAVGMLKTISDYVKEDAQKARFDAAIAAFKTNWVAIIDKICELNPDVKIVVNNYYNPYKPMSALSYSGVDIDKTVDIYIDQMNEFITSHKYNGEKYVVADVVEVGVDKTNVNLVLREIDPHPNTTGHAYIANKVLEAYNSIGKAENTTATAEATTTTENITSGSDTPSDSGEPSDNSTSGSDTPSDSGEPSDNSTSGSDTPSDSGEPSDNSTSERTPEDTTDAPTDTESKATTEAVSTEKPNLEGIGIVSLLGCSGEEGSAAFATLALLLALSVGAALTVVIKKK